MDSIRIGILTVSDGVANGTRVDRSGDAIAAWAATAGSTVVRRDTVSDDGEAITRALLAFVDADRVDVVLTTGGTGFTMRDVTPEATRAVIDRLAPGIAEAIRAHGAQSTPYAWLSRGIAGMRGRTLLVNLPGSEGGVRDGLALLDAIVMHAVQLLRGADTGRHDARPAAPAKESAHG